MSADGWRRVSDGLPEDGARVMGLYRETGQVVWCQLLEDLWFTAYPKDSRPHMLMADPDWWIRFPEDWG